MIRFFSIHNTATEGTHVHLVLTSHRRTMVDAVKDLVQRLTPHHRVPLFFDFGPADSDLRRLDQTSIDMAPIYAACAAKE